MNPHVVDYKCMREAYRYQCPPCRVIIMKALRNPIAVLALASVCSYAFALEPVPWNSPDRAAQFKYFRENASYNANFWAALAPVEQDRELTRAKEPAAERQAAMEKWYAGAMEKWDTARLRGYTASIKEKDLRAVAIWLGREQASALEKKLLLARFMLDKSQTKGLDDKDALKLAPHLTTEAINDLRGISAAAEALDRQKAGLAVKKPGGAASEATLEKISGAIPKTGKQDMSKFFDGSNSRGGVAVDFTAGAQGAASGRPSAAAAKPAAGQQTAAAQIPLPAGSPEAACDNPKSSAFTSNAYGYTITANGQTQTFRDGKKAEAAIRQLPDGSISKIILYGHGSPGMQTVGPEVYDAESTAQLLKGKMAKGGVLQFSGCNTASIGGPTLNPAVGLSMVARRLLYFSLPYFQNRADGVSAEQARQQWDKGWNADLARDTSLGIKGAVVCGYRTFGLVPGRLPGVTRLMGNQEATTPGYVAGRKACYQDGREVAAP